MKSEDLTSTLRHRTSGTKDSSPSMSSSSTQAAASHEFAATNGGKLQKFAVRLSAGMAMLGVLLFSVFYLGHVGVGCLVSIAACELFRELVAVAHCELNREKEIPWFRTVLWCWFAVAMFAAYTSDSLQAPLDFAGLVSTLPVFGEAIAKCLRARHYHSLFALWIYVLSFVATVMSLRPAVLASQIKALSFTAFALSLFVVPMKMIIHNAFVGLFWFLFPLLLVAVNDSFAYFSGFCFGKKIIKATFLSISPNKTWEGFIGGGLATLVAGFYLPPYLSTLFLTCSYETVRQTSADTCTPPALFSHETFEGVVDIQFHGLALACFASLVAPFGGFCASSIKRAYALKDFSNVIPGHGGLMDRLDCQFLMALATFVHLKTFVLSAQPEEAVAHALRAVDSLSPNDRAELMTALTGGH